MSLRFHWFLPTNGDGRDIVGGGHGVATGAAALSARRPSLTWARSPAAPNSSASRER
jgi:alkanesulfonate monooxygenase